MKIIQVVLLCIALTLLHFQSWSQTNVIPDEVELAVLKNIYDSLGGSGWTTKTNWPTVETWPASATSAQFGTWFGVTVSNGDIQKITLPGNNLTGVLPKSIAQLTRLKYVYLGTNQISGTIPPYTGLPLLQHLLLSNNLLTGPIPAELGSLAGLTILKLDNNSLSGTIPTELGNLPLLTDLFLNNNQLSGSVPSSLGNLSNLVYLYLRNNQLIGSLPSSLGSLTKLQYFYTGYNQLTGTIPATVSGLSQLLIFDINTNQLSGPLPDVSGWTKVTQINVANNQLSGAIPSGINMCTALTILRADMNSFTSLPSSLLSLPVIVSIIFDNNEINSIPDFSTQVNKANLTLQLKNNRLDFGQLEMIEGKGIKTVTYNAQKLLNDVNLVNVPPGGTLFIQGRARGQNGSMTWYFRQTGTSSWYDINSLNEDATQHTFTKAGMQLTDKGEIKYKMTNTVVTGFTIESVPVKYNTGYDIVWKDVTGVAVNVNTISKTAASGWGSGGAASVNELAAGTDGWIEFIYDQSTCEAAFGFSDTNPDDAVNSIDYGVLVNGTQHQIVQNGTVISSYALAQGDVLRIERVGSSMNFYRNNALEHTLTNVSTGLLIGDAAINGTGCKIYNARASFWIPAIQGQIPDIWEAAVLKNVYDSLGGTSWTTKTNWPTVGNWAASYTIAQMDTWYGITVANGDITRIELPANNLNGKIPKSLGQLTKMQILRLQSNSIGGSIPSELMQATALTTLHLGTNMLTGPVPESIGNLTNLYWLGLYRNTLTGTLPASLFSMANLEYLYIYYTGITGQIPQQINLPKIRVIYLYQNNLLGPIPSAIGNLQPTLTSLALENNPSMGGSIPQEIGNLTKLTELWLDGNGHTGTIPPSLGNLTQLKVLNIFKNQLEGTIPSTFKNLVNLEWAALSENQLSGSIPAFFGKMTKMDSLWLNDNQFKGTIPDSLQYATSLALLSVSRNQLSGNLPAWLGNLSLMKTLQAAGNSFTGKIPDQLQNLDNLKILDLSFTDLSDSIPEWLVSKAKLRMLYLNDSKFTFFPQFSTRSDKNMLKMKIENNGITVTNIEQNFISSNIHPFSTFSYGPQMNTKLRSTIQVQENDTLQIVAPSGGVYGAYLWERLVNGSWVNINNENQSSTPAVFFISATSIDKQGTYRYKVTNTWLNDIIFESGPIEIMVTDPVQSAIDQLSFQYRYDQRNRLIKKKIPGADWVYMVYDDRDRLVMTQDGNQRALSPSQWTFTKYDMLNRPVLTGIYNDIEGKDQEGMQQKVNDFYAAAASNADLWFEIRGITVHGYTNQSFPLVSSGSDYFTVTYYDDYDFKSLINDVEFDYDNSQLPAASGLKGQEEQEFKFVSGHVTGTKAKVVSDNSWLWAVHYYDDTYRPIQTISQNHKGGRDKVTNVYDFVGKILRTKAINSIPGQSAVSVTRRFEYDHAGRLLKTWHQVDTHPEILLSENIYNELGEVITKKLHSEDGESFKQHVDYRYNIRGWLSRINNADLSNNDGGPRDFFGMELGYNNDLNIGDFAPQYNGNISSIKWSANLGFASLTEPTERAYKFTYDPMNRLLEARHSIKRNTWAPSDAFSETIDYDLNGNISYLKRSDVDGKIADELFYNYGNGVFKSNQLLSISDGGLYNKIFKDGNSSGRDFWYDRNGNTIKDLNKDITQVSFDNYLNLPQEAVKQNGERVKTTYSANGLKLAQEVFAPGSSVPFGRTDFIGQFVFQDGKLKTIQHELGRIVIPNEQATDTTPEYQYQIEDHLDNVRLTFTAKVALDEFKATMEDNGQAEITNPRVQELAYFGNLFETEIKNVNQWLNHTGIEGGNAVYLDGSETKSIGPYSLLKVFPGDTVKMEAFGKFETRTSYDAMPVLTLLAILANPVHTVATATEAGASVTTSGLIDELSPFVSAKGSEGSGPSAYLNYIFFDKDFNVVDYKYEPIDPSAGFEPAGEGTVDFDRMELNKIIDRQGFLYVYVSNESPGTRVWMDDLTITYKHSPIIQFEDYYPFGLSMAGTAFERDNDQYNGMVTTQGLGLKDLGFRSYDPAAGRFYAVDPLAERDLSGAPYQYAGNNPVRYLDVLGLDPPDPAAGTGGTGKVVLLKIRNFFKAVSNSIKGLRTPGGTFNKSSGQRKAGKDTGTDRKGPDKGGKAPDTGGKGPHKGGKGKDTGEKDTNTGGGSADKNTGGDIIVDLYKDPYKTHAYDGPNRKEDLILEKHNGIDNRLQGIVSNKSSSDAPEILYASLNNEPLIVEAYDRARRNPNEETRQYLLGHFPVKEAMVCYYRARWDNINDPSRQAFDASMRNDATGQQLEEVNSNKYLDELLDAIKKANTGGEDNPTPGEVQFDPEDFPMLKNAGELNFGEEPEEHHVIYEKISSGRMDTDDPDIFFDENSNEIEITFKDKDNGQALLKMRVNNTVSARAFMKRVGADEHKIDAVVSVILTRINEENEAAKPAGEKASVITDLVNVCASDEKHDKSNNTDDLQGLSNVTKISLIEVLFNDDKTFDSDEEEAVNNLIDGTKTENIMDLHDRLQNEPEFVVYSDHTLVLTKLLNVILDKESDYKPVVEDDHNYARLMMILSEQFQKKALQNPEKKPDNSTAITDKELIDYNNWTGAEDQRIDGDTKWHFIGVLDVDGKLIISKQIVEETTDPLTGSVIDNNEEVIPYATYDHPLDDVVLITPKEGTELAKLTNNQQVLVPAIWLYYDLDQTINERIKFNAQIGMNVAFFMLGAGYLSSAEGALFYLGVIEVTASGVNVGLDLLQEDLEDVLDEGTISNIRLLATFVEVGAGVQGLLKSASIVDLLRPKAASVMDAAVDGNTLTGSTKLCYLEAIEGAKDVNSVARTADVVSSVKTATPSLSNFLDGIPDKFKFANKEGTEISVFSRSNDGAKVSEVGRIVKDGNNYVFKIVDNNILNKIDVGDVARLTQDMIDQPTLVQAMGDNPELARAWSAVTHLSALAGKDLGYLKLISEDDNLYDIVNLYKNGQRSKLYNSEVDEALIYHYSKYSSEAREKGSDFYDLYKSKLDDALEGLPAGLNNSEDVYGGYNFTDNIISQFVDGNFVHFDDLLSTSKSSQVAEEVLRIKGGNVYIEIVESSTGKSIKTLSSFPSEEEVLFHSEALFRVKGTPQRIPHPNGNSGETVLKVVLEQF